MTNQAMPLHTAVVDEAGETSQDRAYNTLKNAVLAGYFYPGTVVTLRKLSEMLGTSDMPVREALKRLTAEGAFEALPNRSARVPVLTRQQMKQVLELRVLLESKAAIQATENISKRQIDELASLQDQMEQALDAGDPGLYISLNKQFHFSIYKIADNGPLLTLIEALWLRMAPVVAFNLTRAGNGETNSRPARTHHFEIIDALQARDAEKVGREIAQDLMHPAGLSQYWDSAEQLAVLTPAKGTQALKQKPGTEKLK